MKKLQVELFILIVLSLVLLASALLLANEKKERLERFKAHEMQFFHEQELLWKQLFKENFADLRGLASFDDQDDPLPRLSLALQTLLRTDLRYFQGRYLSEDGQELLRWDRSSSGVVFETKPAQLQNKMGRPYARRALALTPGQIYVSRLDLNVEQGQVEQPFRPTYRVVLRTGGGIPGLLVLNVNAREMLTGLRNLDREDQQYFLVNGGGIWLVGPAPELEWGGSLGHQKTVFSYESELSEGFLGAGVSEKLDSNGQLWLSFPLNRGELGGDTIMFADSLFLVSRASSVAYLPSGRIHQPGFQLTFLVLTFGVAWMFRQIVIAKRRALENSIAAEQEALVAEQVNNTLKARIDERTEELRDALGFIGSVTDNLPVMIAVWDSNLTCKFINKQAEHWFPFSKDEAVGRNLRDFPAADQPQGDIQYYERARRGDVFEIQGQLRDQAELDRWTNVSFFPIELDGERCCATVTIDVTELKSKEQDLVRVNSELQTRTREAEAAAISKAHFLANMSHEIRTPMNAIIGMLVLLLDQRLEDHARNLAKNAFVASESLLQLLNDILDLSKVDADQVQLEIRPFEIDAMVHRTVDLFALAAEEKRLRLSVSMSPRMPCVIESDLLRISQVVSNLIGNAIKFTNKGDIHVSFDFDAVDDVQGVLKVAVSDTGIGISEENLEGIFETFQQATESTNRKFGGTGLGLTISKKLCLLLGGQLSVKSQIGKGSSFTAEFKVTIPEGTKKLSELEPNRHVRLIHYGTGEDLDMLAEYCTLWSVEICPAESIDHGLQLLSQAERNGESRPLFLVGLGEGARDNVGAPIQAALERGHVGIVRKVVLLASSQFNARWLPAFRTAGGEVVFEPLTPSKLFNRLLSPRPTREVSFELEKSIGKARYSRLNVLVVDDLAVNLEIVESYLKSFGIEAHTATSGAEALAKLVSMPFDLVLMDLHLVGETGQDVTRTIRATPNLSQPVIAALSASAMESDRSSAMDAGMNDYLTKPVLPKDILNLLETHFGAGSTMGEEGGPPTESPPVENRLPEFISQTAYDNLFSDDPELYVRCLRLFLVSVEDMALSLERAIASQDTDAAKEIVHRLKGASANIADEKLQLEADFIEKELNRHGALGAVPELVAMIRSHSQEFKVFLNEAADDNTRVIADKGRFPEALASIMSSLKRNRLVNEKDMACVLEHLLATRKVSLANEFRNAVEQFDYRKARGIADRFHGGGGLSSG